jgi:hypothetical protein
MVRNKFSHHLKKYFAHIYLEKNKKSGAKTD